MNLLRKKDISHSISLTKKKGSKLKRTLTTFDVIAMTVGGSIGAGIFSITANTAANYSGPSVIISFIITSILCILISYCYLEFATAVPVAGSAYSFSYISLGEIFAWIIGWALILEVLFSAALVANAWSSYLKDMFRMLGINIKTGFHFFGNSDSSLFTINFDIASILIILIIGMFVLTGTKISSKAINILTIIKVSIILFLIIAGLFFISKQNWNPFIPPNQSILNNTQNDANFGSDSSLLSLIFHKLPSRYGISGIFTGAAIVFVSFIGFDIVASSAEEVKKPKKTLPLGILGGVFILGFLYIAVSAVITGMVPYHKLKEYAVIHNSTPTLSTAFEIHRIKWAGIIISAGIVIGLLAILILFIFATARLFFAISRDGLLPKWLSKTKGKNNIPKNATILILVFIIIAESFFNLNELTELINFSALIIFTIISLSIPIMRKHKNFNPVFKVPFSPFLPIFTSLSCVLLMLNFSVFTWFCFIGYLIFGMIVYFMYSRKHSLLNNR